MSQVIPQTVLTDLKARYAEPHRAYHSWTHIADLLEQFAQNRATIGQPVAVELAVLFHDAIYDPRSATNEADSAALLARTMQERTAERDLACASALILATHRHTTDDVSAEWLDDAKLFLDMDLAILGADEKRFDAYDAAIRQEYAFVPIEDYCKRRGAILRRFLERPRLYLT